MDRVVYVPQSINDDALKFLAENSELVVGYGSKAQDFDAVCGSIEGILVRTNPMDASMIDAAPKLKVIARHGVGVDNVDVSAAAQRGIPVLITPQANFHAVAEHVFALLLAVRRNVLRSDQAVRAGRFKDRDGLIGEQLAGTTLGIVGLGRVGSRVAAIARDGFGMKVIGFDPWIKSLEMEHKGVVPVAELADLLPIADAISIHIPLVPETRGLIGKKQLEMMPPNSVLIQTSRGGIVDEKALVEALLSGTIGGAGVDVFEDEPPVKDHPLFAIDQAVLTPHVAAFTSASTRQMALDAAHGIVDVLNGANPNGHTGSWSAVPVQ